jgi:hypothetical protein
VRAYGRHDRLAEERRSASDEDIAGGGRAQRRGGWCVPGTSGPGVGRRQASGGRYVTSACQYSEGELSAGLLSYCCVNIGSRWRGVQTIGASVGFHTRGAWRDATSVAQRQRQLLGVDAQDCGTLQGLRGRNIEARLKLWLEAMQSMQRRLLRRALVADEGGGQVAGRCCVDEEQQLSGCDVCLRAN